MKKFYLMIGVALLIPFAACQNNEHHDDHDGHVHELEEGHHHELEDEDEHDHEHEHGHAGAKNPDEISISPERAGLLGIKSIEAKAVPFGEVLEVAGTIMSSPQDNSVVTAPTSGIVTLANGAAPGMKVSRGQAIASISGTQMAGGDVTEAARLAYEAAKRELDRVTPLHAEGIVSTRDYNAALQAYNAAKAAYSGGSSAGRTATAPTAGVLTMLNVATGQYVEAGQPIATVSGSGKLTLKADVPERLYGSIGSIESANVTLPFGPTEAVDLSKLGARVVSASTPVAVNGYIPVYIEFRNDGTMMPGTSCQVALIGRQSSNAIVVPLTSLSEQQGNFFVYVQLDEDCYEKRPVRVGRRDGKRVELLSGVNEGENVVAEGTTMVRLAETASVVPEGHSHHH